MKLANKLTILRILLIPFFLACIVYYREGKENLRWLALGIFGLAVATDFVDGVIARVKGEITRLGSVLDPLADKLLLVTAFIALSQSSLPLSLPPWVVITVISRDVILVIGAVIVHFVTGNLEVIPSFWGKLSTVFQMATIIGVLTFFPFSYILWSAAVFLTVVSGFSYIYRGSKLLSEKNNA